MDVRSQGKASETVPKALHYVWVQDAPGPARLPAVSEPVIEVRRSARRRKTVSVHREGEIYVVVIPARLTRSQEADATRSVMAQLQAKERRTLAPRGDGELRGLAVTVAQTYLADQPGVIDRLATVRWSRSVSRWGSCSTVSGEIRLSSRLRTCPRWVVEHVLLHELAHLVHHDHSAAFHELAERHPRSERAEGFLAGLSHGLAHAQITDGSS